MIFFPSFSSFIFYLSFIVWLSVSRARIYVRPKIKKLTENYKGSPTVCVYLYTILSFTIYKYYLCVASALKHQKPQQTS